MTKRVFRTGWIFILSVFTALFLLLFALPLWRHLVSYPRWQREARAFQQMRREPPAMTSLNTYRGILHAHSYWSHDSEGTLHDIIPAARNAGIDFIFLTDHPHGNRDTFPRGIKGYFDGVLIEPGSEKAGFVTWPLDTAILDWSVDKDSLAAQIVSRGGILFYAHTEEPHHWENPDYQGMEIYNFHTDTKDESLPRNILNFIVNGKKFRPWAMRQMFDEQSAILSLWDSLNMKRKIVGFSAADTHENQNVRARYLRDGRVEWVGPNANVIDTTEVKWWNRWLLREPDENGWIFKWMIDTYQDGFNHVTNYVLADTLSVTSLACHLKRGHLYTAFKSLGDARGFMFWSENATREVTGILGDSVQISRVSSLRAISPLPGDFRLIYEGRALGVSPEGSYEWVWNGPFKKGAYRVEVHIGMKNRIIPWLYSNPVYIY